MFSVFYCSFCFRPTFFLALHFFLFYAVFGTALLVIVAKTLGIGGLILDTFLIFIFTFVAAFCDTGRVSKANLYTWDHQTFDLAFPYIACAHSATVGFAGQFTGVLTTTEVDRPNIRTSG